MITGRAGYVTEEVMGAEDMLAGVRVHRVGGTRATRSNLIVRALQSSAKCWAHSRLRFFGMRALVTWSSR